MTPRFGINVDNIIDVLGPQDYVEAFFLTICHHLEGGERGVRFPESMNGFYEGVLHWQQAGKAKEQVLVIREELAKLPPDSVMGHFSPPEMDSEVADSTATNLAEVFRTRYNTNFFEIILECLDALIEQGHGVLRFGNVALLLTE